ncbi:MAG: helix-turn-helix domain-containing protein [Planctomycetota bacterium]|nr:helix-turn-helix domain-containing protein [Planctomycetota bacterium]
MQKLDGYLTLNQAAEFLGVPVHTLKNWVANGKLPVHRNPINNYRLLKKENLEELLAEVEQSVHGGAKPRRKSSK